MMQMIDLVIYPELCETGDEKDLRRSGRVGETKFDGTRGLIIKRAGKVEIQNRDGVTYTRRLPELVQAASVILGDFTLDGEIVYIDPKTGRTEFTPCQRRCSTSDIGKVLFLKTRFPVQFRGFDLLEFEGQSVEEYRYLERKEQLKKMLCKTAPSEAIKYVPHRFDLEEFFEESKANQEEGIILKDVNSRYEPGRRSFNWLKVKNWRHEVCDVVGYTEGQNARSRFFGALVLAREGRFRGLVGGGFNDIELRRIRDLLRSRPTTAKPFEIGAGEPYTAVDVKLKVEAKYYKITESGVMRFPSFIRVVK